MIVCAAISGKIGMCQSYPESDCTILTQDDEAEGFYVEAPGKDVELLPPDADKAYGIAADIGTTTVAMQLVELQTGKTADVYPFRPVNIGTIHTTNQELFGKQENFPACCGRRQYTKQLKLIPWI